MLWSFPCTASTPQKQKKKRKNRTYIIQKYHFGLTSSSLSVNSLYWYHSAPALPTGNGGLTKISTGLGMCTAKSNSPAVSIDFCCENLCDLLTGSTVSHPRPDIAISQTGLHKQKQEISYLSSNHKYLHFWPK